MKEIFATSAEMLGSGLAPGLMPEQIPLWADGKEVVFANASVRTVAPRLTLFDFDGGSPLDAAQSFTLARRRLYLGTTQGVYRYVGPQTEYESPSLLSTQSPSGFFQQILAQSQDNCLLVPWGDYIISTDGSNPVKYDENTGTMGDLGGTPFAYARVMWKYFSHLFAADTDLSGRRVYWSALDDPEVWTATLSNDAGSNPLRDLDSRIRCGALLGQNQAIYSQDQMVLSRYIGGQDVFYFGTAVKGIGALNPRSIIEHQRFNWGLHRRGIFYTDGVTFDYVDEPRIRAWLKANVNWDLSYLVRGWHDEAAQMVCWTVPTGGGFVTIGYGYKNQAFTIVNEGARFGEEADVFDACLLGFESAVAIQEAGTTPASWVETKPLHLGTRETEKTFQMVHLDVEYEGSFEVEISFWENTMRTLSPITTQTYTQDDFLSEDYIAIQDGGFAANAISLKFSSPAESSFRLGGFQLFGVPAGEHK